jgi:hypothetical protein
VSSPGRTEDPRPVIALAVAIVALALWHFVGRLHLDLAPRRLLV